MATHWDNESQNDGQRDAQSEYKISVRSLVPKVLDFFSSTQATRSAICYAEPSASHPTHQSGIALKPTVSINVHGAFPKNRSVEQWEPN